MSLDDLRQYLIAEPDVVRDRSPDDTMFTGDEDHYWGSGLSALQSVKVALLTAGRTDVGRILDLPCGYGRVMRYLRGGFPDAEIVACDLKRGGVDFCASTFGAIPVYSVVDPAKLELPGTFDLIWCGSLFTHLPPEGWRQFLNLFDSVLEKGGLLIFTTHGRMTATFMADGYTFGMNERVPEMLQRADDERFAYGDYDDEEGYGISLSYPDWVTKEIQKRGNLRLLNYTEAGWIRHQDIVVYQKPPADWNDLPPAGTVF
jgi:SAM-dependent methyltransferase